MDRSEIARLLGAAGGKATAAKRTPKQRSEAASRAGKAKWAAMTPDEREAHLERMRQAAADKRKDRSE
ncbi:MAG: hypothetical protein ABIG63_17550 [Chloroflexota bacterium]